MKSKCSNCLFKDSAFSGCTIVNKLLGKLGLCKYYITCGHDDIEVVIEKMVIGEDESNN